MTILQSMDYVALGGVHIHKHMHQFVCREVLPMTRLDANTFWSGVANIFKDFAPINQKLLLRRRSLQAQLDAWYQQNTPPRPPTEEFVDRCETFLRSISYIEAAQGSGTIETSNVDDEIALWAGPQLVAPINNARFAVNACNARWASLYDALYRSDIIPQGEGFEIGSHYNILRGEAVVRYAKQILDSIFPLKTGHHGMVVKWFVKQNSLFAELDTGELTTLVLPESFKGYRGTFDNLSSILMIHNDLHVEIKIDHERIVGRLDPAGIDDIIVEAALTTIMDCEDSVAVVDAQDKVLVYKNWLALMRGTLSANIVLAKGDETRRMNADRNYQTLSGDRLVLPGRSLMLIRNVGLHMMTDIVLGDNGEPLPEGILDAVITCAIGLHDVKRQAPFQNSRKGSIYIVKPKLHGSDEVRFTDKLFSSVEKLLNIPEYTVKLGIMDEERRTSFNLSACIKAARKRVVFINTGFLDRTGDEIHTSMEAGAFDRKNYLKNHKWFTAYEKNNVTVGLNEGFSGRAQIGKGMWPMPDNLAAMFAKKRQHPESGATTAWVPSPIAAVLHALHYHQVRVSAVQENLLQSPEAVDLRSLIQLPLLDPKQIDPDQLLAELNNNAQSILGYVVRWIDQGIGCSKVADLDNIPLMEDRATLRISSQHIANWLRHHLCTAEQVKSVFLNMAKVVDEQNSGDPNYQRIVDDSENNLAFQAALELVFNGCRAENGYTEETLHKYRKKKKAQAPVGVSP